MVRIGIVGILKKMMIGRAFSTERGRIRFFGITDWTMQPAISLAYVLQKVGEKNGEDFLFKLGYESGKLGANEMLKVTGGKLKLGGLKKNILIELLDFIGEGRMEVIRFNIQKKGGHDIIIQVKDNPTAECANRLYGSKSMVCSFFRGVYSAHGEMSFGVKNMAFKELRCICKRNPYYCVWQSRN